MADAADTCRHTGDRALHYALVQRPGCQRHRRGLRKTVPVWSVAPESVIVSPAPGQTLKRGTRQEVWGWAWADRGIDRVDVSVDGGATWMEAQVEPRMERAWQRFVLSWRATVPGVVVRCSSAYSHDGATQPEVGRRNAIHRIEVKVV